MISQQQNLGRIVGTCKLHFSLPVAKAAVRSQAAVLLLLIVAPIVWFCVCSMFCCALMCVLSSCFVCLFELILYAPVNNFQLCRDGSSCVESVLS